METHHITQCRLQNLFKVLADRLHQILQKIIHHSQTGFLASCHIAENILKMMNLIKFCDRTKQLAIVVSLDFEKAFDKIEWEAVYEVLLAMGFSKTYVKMIRVLYKKPLTTVMNNGYWSDWFSPTRGNRQGDPISSLLFTVVVEALGIRIRANLDIKGIYMNQVELLSVQYADDMWVALDPAEENVNNLLKELKQFTKFSGLTINYEKSVAFTLGSLRDSDAKFYTMKKLFWSDGPVKILGIYIHPEWDKMLKMNFYDALKKIKAVLSNWTNRSLSIPGKIVIVNSLVSSLLVYKFLALPSPDPAFFSEYKHLITQFIWNSKIPRIRYSKKIQRYENAGLKLTNLEAKDQALKASWVIKWAKQIK